MRHVIPLILLLAACNSETAMSPLVGDWSGALLVFDESTGGFIVFGDAEVTVTEDALDWGDGCETDLSLNGDDGEADDVTCTLGGSVFTFSDMELSLDHDELIIDNRLSINGAAPLLSQFRGTKD